VDRSQDDAPQTSALGHAERSIVQRLRQISTELGDGADPADGAAAADTAVPSGTRSATADDRRLYAAKARRGPPRAALLQGALACRAAPLAAPIHIQQRCAADRQARTLPLAAAAPAPSPSPGSPSAKAASLAAATAAGARGSSASTAGRGTPTKRNQALTRDDGAGSSLSGFLSSLSCRARARRSGNAGGSGGGHGAEFGGVTGAAVGGVAERLRLAGTRSRAPTGSSSSSSSGAGAGAGTGGMPRCERNRHAAAAAVRPGAASGKLFDVRRALVGARVHGPILTMLAYPNRRPASAPFAQSLAPRVRAPIETRMRAFVAQWDQGGDARVHGGDGQRVTAGGAGRAGRLPAALSQPSAKARRQALRASRSWVRNDDPVRCLRSVGGAVSKTLAPQYAHT
jgi:hypothetical protein